MNMPGMQGGRSVGMHALNLLPPWMGVAWTVVFLAIGASHLRHMAQTTGQRRSWHSCHVLMAVGMAFMYAPAQIDPLAVPSAFWKLVFAAAGIIAAVWAISGVGRVSTLIWLLTSIDMAAMLYMWSGPRRADTAPLTWLLTAYLLAEAVMWALDLHRRLDGATPIVSWRLLASESGATVSAASIATETAASGSLLGELNISASMIAMALGMAYMLIAMQLVV
jgi:Domain of unknown function (DUF5134)